MEIIRQVHKISSGRVVLDNLDQFSGKEVEILVIPLEYEENQTLSTSKAARGRLKKYADPNLISEEAFAWETAVREKHGDL